jgi:hypothetical protein
MFWSIWGRQHCHLVCLSFRLTSAETRFVLTQVFDLWVSYHNTEDGASSVSLSLPHVVGIDARPWVLEEHSLVISAGLQRAC